MLPAAPRGGTRGNLEEGRELELRAASSPSQQHKLCVAAVLVLSYGREHQCPATMRTVDRGFSFEIWTAGHLTDTSRLIIYIYINIENYFDLCSEGADAYA